MKRRRHLWEQIITFENLAGAARDALRGKRGRRVGASFFGEWETEVVRLERELRERTYRPGPYRYFRIVDPKARVVAAAPFRDRVVHHAFVRVIEPIFEKRFIEDSYACRRGKGTHAAMRRAEEFARQFPFALKCDLRQYFASIDHGTLRSTLARVIADEGVQWLTNLILASHVERTELRWPEGAELFEAVACPRGLPIGNLTSQFFANVCLDGFDHFVKQDLHVRGYVRYVDDFVLLGRDKGELRAWGRAVSDYLAGLRLEIHPDNYRLVRTASGLDFCGFVVRADGRIRVRGQSVRRFERRYRQKRWEVKQGRLEVPALTQSVRAWIAHVSHAQSVGLRRAVLSG